MSTHHRYRVVQWTTGKVGTLSLRGILDDPRLDLVGVYAHSENKAGLDAGALCGRPHTGITATREIDALLACGADVVLYTPQMADLDDLTRLLENGLDVISTNLLLNLGGVRGETEARLRRACAKGRSSLHISGVNPGWINTMTAAMTAVCRDIRAVTISESADVSVYESPETWQAFGIGLPEPTPAVHDMARMALVSFRDAVERLATSLHTTLDRTEFTIDYATAARTADLGWLRIEKDTIAALRGGWTGTSPSGIVLRSEIAWHLTPHLNTDWQFLDDHYRVTIDGEPGIDTRVRFLPPDSWGNHEWDTMTAMPAVHAIPAVRAAPPGILGLHDAGLTAAPAGLWTHR
ncbi:hypothetical protein ABZ413_16625 [Nocardia rhamnosiphila]|uniref:NAD(P)H-dependent amine dehydrogenase family protein n=1 Tax=Nocardia rhamnosiphila TaxID=426716 RepID=UPI0033DBCF53